MNSKLKSRISSISILILNIVLVFGIVITFFAYDNNYKQKLYSQNIDEISNINQASANVSSAFFSSRESKLRDLALYIEGQKLTFNEVMNFIYSSNSDIKKTFEIIDSDSRGYRIERDLNESFIPLDYSSGYGNICKIFQDNIKQTDSQIVTFAPEFTDGYTALKSFALYNCLQLVGEDGSATPYTLMLVSTSADFIDMININSGYNRLDTVIINKSGDYIIGSSNFKSDNFYDYLMEFNDLSLDEQNKIKSDVNGTKKGILSYKNARNQQSVFVYTPVKDKDWYCISVVPIENFRNISAEYSFTFIVVAFMALLLTIDLLFLASLNRKLKISAENERIASAAKTDFLSRMSHDMRTPMNGIIGMTRLTQDIPDLPEEAQENLADISYSSAYLLQLINDTLDMSKIESNKFTLNPETVDSEELIKHIITAIKPIVDQKQIELEIVPINTKLGYIRTDYLRVQQVFLNILSNAVKFTPEHGKIRIEVEVLKRENGILYDRISIEDTGCGMSKDFLEHIFEPFSQERTRIVRGQEGTGLGMAIVKNLVEMMGGRIEIESQVGIGTKVTVFIGFPIGNPTEQKNSSNNVDIDILSGKHVLLVEDHPMNANIAKRLLDKKNMLTDHAENGADAVKMFCDSETGYYDIVLMDIRMPEMDGLEATRRIRALDRCDAKNVPIIAMTANAYAEDVQAAMSAGMNAHLAKPIEPEILYEAICKYLQF